MLLSRKDNPLGRQIIFFALVGGASTAFNYALFIILARLLFVHYLIAAAVGFIGGVLLGFWFNEGYTFKSTFRKSLTFPIYIVIYLISLTVNLFVLTILVSVYNWDSILSNLILAPLIIVLNFLGTKILVFKNKTWH